MLTTTRALQVTVSKCSSCINVTFTCSSQHYRGSGKCVCYECELQMCCDVEKHCRQTQTFLSSESKGGSSDLLWGRDDQWFPLKYLELQNRVDGDGVCGKGAFISALCLCWLSEGTANDFIPCLWYVNYNKTFGCIINVCTQLSRSKKNFWMSADVVKGLEDDHTSAALPKACCFSLCVANLHICSNERSD